jgi:hypothetical protein
MGLLYINEYGKTIMNEWVGKKLEGGNKSLFEGTILSFSWRDYFRTVGNETQI